MPKSAKHSPRIELALTGKLNPGELSDEENAVYLEAYAEMMWHSTPEADAFFADRRKKGLGVGLDDEGNLVYQKPCPDTP